MNMFILLASLFLNTVYYVCVLSICVLIFPFACCIATIILVVSGAPVLFCQTRTGKDGRQFIMYKFRTMVLGAESIKKKLATKNEAHGPVFKIHHDPRFTKIGKFLAHTGLDELPQLWNVIIGDMSLIGPRPLPVSEADKLLPWQRKRLCIKPGIISPWILQGYHTMSFDAWMKSDIAYSKSKSFMYDVSLGVKVCVFLVRLFIRECRTVIQSNLTN